MNELHAGIAGVSPRVVYLLPRQDVLVLIVIDKRAADGAGKLKTGIEYSERCVGWCLSWAVSLIEVWSLLAESRNPELNIS